MLDRRRCGDPRCSGFIEPGRPRYTRYCRRCGELRRQESAAATNTKKRQTYYAAVPVQNPERFLALAVVYLALVDRDAEFIEGPGLDAWAPLADVDASAVRRRYREGVRFRIRGNRYAHP